MLSIMVLQPWLQVVFNPTHQLIFESAVVETIIIVFMLITGLNFTLIWFMREGDWRKAFRDEEARWYVLIITTATLLVCCTTDE